MITVRLNFLALVLLLCASAPLAAKDYYVSPRGNDLGPGSRIHPWRTLEQVARVIADWIDSLVLPNPDKVRKQGD